MTLAADHHAGPLSLSEHIVGLAMRRLRAGSLDMAFHKGATRHYEGSQPGPSAVVTVRDPAAARRLLAATSIGMAEGYIDGLWDTPDLDAVLSLGLANLMEKPKPLRAPLDPMQRAWHALRDNSPLRSRRNVAHHYDIGNDFYRLWLDDTMTYSSAVFETPGEPLETAQRRKWDRLLELLQPRRQDRVLEIGCGWGGFAIHAARQAECHVTGITLSREQQAWATRAAREAGVDDRVEIRLEDYRRVSGSFDAIASIEMFEAVGERWWPVFFARLRELLGGHGTAALQTITIDERHFPDYRRRPDFIQRYIFPGGMLPSPRAFADTAQAAGLSVSGSHAFGESYATTLAEWRVRFEAALPAVTALGFDERFVRMWRYYLAYCRAGFEHGPIDVMQVRLEA